MHIGPLRSGADKLRPHAYFL